MIFNSEFTAVELAIDELEAINVSSPWTTDGADRRVLAREIAEARRCLYILRANFQEKD